jgi:glutaredoxin-like protein
MTEPEDPGRKTIGLGEFLNKYLPAPVKLVLFTSRQAPASKEQRRLLEEIAKLSSKLSLEVHDLETNGDVAKRYAVAEAPCTAIVGTRDFGLRFYGVTVGHELSALLEVLLMASHGRSGLDPALEEAAGQIDRPTQLEVFVTLTCPICPSVVHVVSQVAVAVDNVRADIVVSDQFPGRARAHDVRAVPLVIVNGHPAFHGLRSAEEIVLDILRIAAPGAFEEFEARLRAKRRSEPGAGPDRSRVRRDRRRSRAGRDVGRRVRRAQGAGCPPRRRPTGRTGCRHGQDRELARGGERRRARSGRDVPGHMEQYRMAEALHTRVAAVDRQGETFVARAENGTEFRGAA